MNENSTARTLAAAALAALALACQQTPLQEVAPSDEAVLLTVPVVRQDVENECGLASVDALCAYHGVELPDAERRRLAELAEERRGLSGTELQQSLGALGLDTFVFEGTLDHEATGLFRHVDRGRPLLVMIAMEEGTNHYCLVEGYDLGAKSGGNVFLLDPQRGRLVLPVRAFDVLWKRAGRFTLLCTPPAAA